MDDWIKNLWKENKLVFFLLIPLILIIFFRDLIISLIVGNARKVANKAKAKDAELKAKADAANIEADKLKSQSDKAEDRIKKDPGLDWHDE